MISFSNLTNSVIGYLLGYRLQLLLPIFLLFISELNILPIFGQNTKYYSQSKIERLNNDLDLDTSRTFVNSKIGILAPKKGISFFNLDNDGFNFFTYHDSLFWIKVDPLFSYSYLNGDGLEWKHRKNGLNITGSLTQNFYFYLSFYDNLFIGKNVKERNLLTSQKGFNTTRSKKDEIEFDNVDVCMSYIWDWGHISFGKYNPVWGTSERSQLIFSNKAPSFPLIQLDLQPADWFSFRYFHGWLHSNIIDSNSVRYTFVKRRNSYQHIPKYIAAHMITIYPTQDIIINMGESIIYSEKIELLYLIPIMFFRSADHYQQDNVSNTGHNAQFFADVVYRIPDWAIRFYSSLFIDELDPASITDLNSAANSIAYSLGLKKINILFKNNSLTAEYTRSNPFVYMNSNGADLYTNHGYYLGDWLGSNADALYIKYYQELIPDLDFSIWTEYIRKGAKEDPEQQYQLPYPDFLFGDVSILHNMGLNINYRILGKIKLTVEYIHRFKNTSRFLTEYYLIENNLLSMSLSYGF